MSKNPMCPTCGTTKNGTLVKRCSLCKKVRCNYCNFNKCPCGSHSVEKTWTVVN